MNYNQNYEDNENKDIENHIRLKKLLKEHMQKKENLIKKNKTKKSLYFKNKVIDNKVYQDYYLKYINELISKNNDLVEKIAENFINNQNVKDNEEKKDIETNQFKYTNKSVELPFIYNRKFHLNQNKPNIKVLNKNPNISNENRDVNVLNSNPLIKSYQNNRYKNINNRYSYNEDKFYEKNKIYYLGDTVLKNNPIVYPKSSYDFDMNRMKQNF